MRSIRSGGRGVGKGSRLKPLEVLPSSIARIATCTRCHPEAAGFAGGDPIGLKAPRRPHSSPTRRRDHRAANHTLRSVLLGEGTVSCMPRSFAPVMSTNLVSQVCERELRTRFVLLCQARSERDGNGLHCAPDSRRAWRAHMLQRGGAFEVQVIRVEVADPGQLPKIHDADVTLCARNPSFVGEMLERPADVHAGQ